MSSLQEKLSALPQKPGVYLFKDNRGQIIYVGKAKSLRKRVASYFTKRDEIKTSILLSRLADIDYITTGSEMDALILEDELIKKYKPRYNVSLRDDKSYPLIKLTIKEEWPRLLMVRKKENDGARYFGRYRGGMVREVLRLVKKLFPIRWCKESPLRRREQPCLYYHIGSCSGPCIGKIDQASYRQLLKGVIALLKGNMDEAEAKLREEMARAAQEQDFEKAAYLRDRIQLLQKMMEGKNLKKAPAPRQLFAIEALKQALGLKQAPMRIEAFDISNIQASNIVGAMVVFYGGVPLKKDYRKFKVRSVQGKPDDVAAIYEVVKRRYSGALASELPLPDLIMIDGGRGQLNSARRALQASGLANLPAVGLAKREEEIFMTDRRLPLKLPRAAEELKLLQRVRDEAHRFAVSFHRHRRSRQLFGA
jgi:excinuclease ABC subunit C